jgi:hypothetical protein
MKRCNNPEEYKLNITKLFYVSQTLSALLHANALFKKQNVHVEWLAVLLRIRVIPVPNLGPKTGYPD